MNRRINISILFCVLLGTKAIYGQVEPAGVFGDHMVVQRDRAIPVWGTAASDETVMVQFNGQMKTITADAEGKWKIELEACPAGGPYEMTIAGEESVTFKDVYVGEVWLCSGQSNMDMTVAREDRYWCGVLNEAEEVAAAEYPLIRVFDAAFATKDEPQAEVRGTWEVCSPKTVGHFSAAAYFFARELHKKLNVPIGLVTTAYGASTAEAWTSRPALEAEPSLRFLLEAYEKSCQEYDSGAAQKKYDEALAKWQQAADKAKAEGRSEPRKPSVPKNPHLDQHSPCVLYNAMIAPLVPYAMRGAIWYQGESNGGTAKHYDRIMETLIKDWRAVWGQGDFPFLYVQLANHGEPSTEPCRGGGMAPVRQAQLKNLSIPKTAMATAIDIGDAKDIHPKNKQEVGLRLSLAARALAYGESIDYMGPIYDHHQIEGSSIRLYFMHSDGGLVAKDGQLKGFAVAGDDKRFVRADARIDGDTVVVSCSEVDRPVAVRYAYDANPAVSLYNKAGLPASPFRTDDF